MHELRETNGTPNPNPNMGTIGLSSNDRVSEILTISLESLPPN